jgi:predicted GNAT family N-acyltransferase
MPRPFTIRVLDWSGAKSYARPVRERVFIEEQRVPRELEWDEWDESCEHAVACDAEGAAIGTARLRPDGRLGRMAVLRAWRRRGVGAGLLAALLRRAHDRGIVRITLHAQTHAAGFYRRFGFSEQGGEFLEAGIPHVEMALEIGADRA